MNTEQESNKRNRRKRFWRWIAIPAALLILAAAVLFGLRYHRLRQAELLRAEAVPGTWIEIAPEGIVSGNGEPVYTEMRIGTENKVIVLFYGGGVSVSEYMASRPYIGTWTFADEIGFYAADLVGTIPDYLESGIGTSFQNNPFRDWTILVIPYTTGDFHMGTADYAYTDMDGEQEVLHHHGYTNFRAIMDEAMLYLDEDPEQLLIAGWSAGGFGAAALAGELIEEYFPGAGNTTLCVDSSILLWDGFAETAREIWGAPEEIADRIRTENLIVDLMSSLYDTYGDSLTYLYIGSTHDGALARYQNYFNTGVYRASNAQGQLFLLSLRDTLSELKRSIPTLGVYLFDDVPFSMYPSQFMLTQHTMIISPMAFTRLTDRVRPIDWLMNAVEGRAEDHGMQLLQGTQWYAFF